MSKTSKKSSIDDYDFSMKKRLVGAAILISFAVLILPWLLGSYDNNGVEKKTDVAPGLNTEEVSDLDNVVERSPNKQIVQADDDKSVFISRVQPIDASGSAKTSVIAESKALKNDKIKSSPKKDLKINKVAEKKVSKSVKKPLQQKKGVVKESASKSVVRGYIVSVGIFGDSKNANKLVAKLKSQNFSPVTRQEKFKNKEVTRVYMGPFTTRSQAGKIKLRLFEEQKVPSLLKEFP